MKIRIHPDDILIVAATVMCGLTVGLLARSAMAAQPATPYQPTAQVAEVRNQQLHPLTLTALAQRSYGGGSIAQEDLPAEPGVNYAAQVVSYPSDDMKQYALVATPKSGAPAGGYPVVVLAHGFIPGDQYQTGSTSYQAWVEGLTARGYMVVQPDYRGHGASWGAPESAYYGSGYVHDVLNLAVMLQRYPGVNERQMVLMGHSLGGHVALKAATARPELFKAVAVAGGSSATAAELTEQSFASEAHPSIHPALRESLIGSFGAPSEESAFWRSTSPSHHLDRLRQPVWVGHCADDVNVPKALSDRLHQRLQQAGISSDYFECQSGGHGFAGEATEPSLASLADFLDRSLP